ncbi:MAG: NAD-dependent epimerase/dehydratase family protein [Ornithinimicrobium sp.]
METPVFAPVIIGAGPVGRALVDRLSARSLTPRLLTRSGSHAAGATAVRVDATDATQLREAIEGADVVFQCAQPPYHQWVDHFPALQRAILEACADAGAALIAVENLYGYGTHGRVVTEQMPLNPTSKKGEVRAAMSRELAAHHQDGRLRTAAVRASDFIGPEVTESAFGERFFGRLVAGKSADVLGEPQTRHSVTYVPDLVEALIQVGSDPDSWGRAWHAPSAPAMTQAEMVEIVAAHLGVEPTYRRVSSIMLRLVGLTSATVRETIEMLPEFTDDFLMDSSDFEQRFDTAPTPLPESLAATADAYTRRSKA